jgi:hypothetical protein
MEYGDEPPRRRRPPPQKPKGNLRLVIAIMGAVIFGLLVSLLVSCGGGGTKTITETTEITREIPAKGSEEKGKAEEEPEEGAEGEEETGGVEPEEGAEGEETFEGVPEEEGGAVEEAPEEEVFEKEGGGVEAE